MIYRYEQIINEDGFSVTWVFNLEYVDSEDISSWGFEAMSFAIAEEIIIGKTNTTLNPKEKATRTEIATILMRYIINS